MAGKMQGVILAAGKGSRLHPLTLNRTKAMIPILGKPIVERVLETLVENGIREIVMVVSEVDGEIRRHFTEHCDLDVDIQFVVQPERLGMANALSLASPYLHEGFVMSACDNLTPPEHVAELIATHRRLDAAATLSLMKIDLALASRTGVVEWSDGRIRRIVEEPKPEEAPSNISSLPLYVFSPKLLAYLPMVRPSARGEYELQDAIQMLIHDDGYVTGVFTANRLQLTNAADLLALNRHYLTEGGDTPQLAPRSVGQHTHLITPLRIEEDTVIGLGCVIGPRVYIERNCRIGSHVLIKDAVILRDTCIEDGRQIVGEVVS
jgi:NDP-sugar pyrophosphorylase family protein